MEDFSVISYNVRGLQQSPKRIKIFNYVQEKLKNGFAFFQETHSSESSCLSWRQDWKGDLIYNHGTSNREVLSLPFLIILNMIWLINMPITKADYSYAL